MKFFPTPKWATTRVAPTIAILVVAALVVTTLVYQFPNTSRVDVGSGNDAPFVQGFSFRENLPDGSTARWSNGNSEIRFWGVGAQEGVLKLKFALPAQNRAAGAQILVNGRSFGVYAPQNGFQDLTIDPVTRNDVGVSGDLVVQIVSSTFTAPPDTRALGVQVDDVEFVGKGAPVLPPLRVLLFVSLLTLLGFAIGAVWSGTRVGGWIAAGIALAASALGLSVARGATAYFIAPLFFTALLLFVGALAFSIALKCLTDVLPAPALTDRTLRVLFLVMLAAFALRMIFAVGPGYIVDTQDYVVWSYKTVTYGLGSMYAAVNGLWISDQSPGLNYILHVMGLLYRGIFAPDFLYPAVAGDPALRGLSDNPAFLADPLHRTLLRLPMLLADLITGALIFVCARKYVAERGAWLVGLAYWFNPAVLWNGAYWGQTDAIHALLVLTSFILIIFPRRVGWAFFILGIAAFTKPQAMIFGPLLLLGAYRVGNLKGIVHALVFGALGAALVLLPVPFTGGAQGLLAYFGDTVGHHPTLSANAHNLWWVIFHDDVTFPDTAALFPGAPLSYRTLSILLFGIFYLAAVVKAWRAPLEDYFLYGAFVAFAFFMLPTEIHENYGYALLPLMAVAMARERYWFLFYVAISLTMTLNYALHDPPLYTFFGLHDPHSDWALMRRFNASANLVLLGVWTWYLFVPRASSAIPAVQTKSKGEPA